MTDSPSLATSSSASAAVPPSAVGNDNPLGIKIKEITKPEEIRIIDEKPKFVVKVSSTTTTTTTTTESPSTTTTTVTASSSSSSPSDAETTTDSYSTSTFDQFNKTDDPFQLDDAFEQDLVNTTDTNKNVREVHDGGFINGLDVGEEIEPEQVFDEPIVSEDDNDASEVHDLRAFVAGSSTTSSTTENTPQMDMVEAEQQQHKDVKQVIFVDNFGESKPITVSGTSDLQFGGGSPDEDINTYDFMASSSSAAPSDTSTPVYIDENSGSSTGGEFADDLAGKPSTNNEVYVTPGEITAETTGEDETTQETILSLDSLANNSTEGESGKSQEISSEEVETDQETAFNSSSTTESSLSTSSSPVHHEVNENTPLENDDQTNPSYPKLPEDLTQHQHVSNIGNYADAEERSPGEPHLVPEWERNNGTTTTSEEETNSVFDEQRSGENGGTTEGSKFDETDGISLYGDMMSEKAPVVGDEGEEVHANSDVDVKSVPSPKEDVESLKMMSSQGEQGRSSSSSYSWSRRSDHHGAARYFGGETSFWDLF